MTTAFVAFLLGATGAMLVVGWAVNRWRLRAQLRELAFDSSCPNCLHYGSTCDGCWATQSEGPDK